jgi:ATP-dependent DNA ligase
MPLLRLPEPFDHPDWLFEVKHDGFRALAHIDGHHCAVVSRNGHTFTHWPHLCEELAHAVKAHDAVIDGEIVCLDGRGRSNFKSLLFRREWPYFYAFDLLAVDGEDLREWPLIERKRRLRRLIPSVPTRCCTWTTSRHAGGTSSRSRVRTISRASWASLRAVATMRTARAPTGSKSRIPPTAK